MATWIYFVKGQRFGKVQAANIIEASARAIRKAVDMGANPSDVTVRKED